MATIIQILDRYQRPVAEINTFDLQRVDLLVSQRPMLMDEFFRPNLMKTWVRTYEQKMITEHPEPRFDLCSQCGGSGRIRAC